MGSWSLLNTFIISLLTQTIPPHLLTGMHLIVLIFLFSSRLAELMDEHKEELATIESLDSGAVYTLALKTHVGMSIDTVRYFAGWADKIQVKYS